MERRKKIYIGAIAAVLILLLGLFFAYPKIKNRISGKHELVTESDKTAASNAQNSIIDPVTGEIVNSGSDSENSDGSQDTSSDNSSGTDAGSTKNIDVNRNVSVSGNMLAHITTQHCNDDCKAFANNLSFFEYCEQVCGITPVKKVSNCDGKEGIQKDYCLKDLGITKADTSICEKIDDVNVRKTCKDRIVEDIIESQ